MESIEKSLKFLRVTMASKIRAAPALSTFMGSSGGVYTGMRTVNQKSIFSYKEHMERMSRVLEAIDSKHGKPFGLKETTALLTPLIAEELRHYLHENPDAWEMKVTAAMRLKEGTRKSLAETTLEDLDVLVTVQPLGDRLPDSVKVECAVVGGRTNPTVKHATWIEERKTLEDKMRSDCNEVLLLNEENTVLEGMSSNLVLVTEAGHVWTAPSEVTLEGTVLKLLLRVCEEDKIPVTRKCPSINLLKQSSALLTSTSRLALPIDTVYLPGGETASLQVSSAAKRLVDRVKGEFEKYSERIIE
jgi:branched-subunit amino acid aminotransferase/4-amino-4-deoxychorismate lyase